MEQIVFASASRNVSGFAYGLCHVALVLAASGCGEPQLTKKIKAGDTTGAQELIDGGVNVNATGANGQTPLLAAIKSGNKDVFVSLLEHGADPNVYNDKGTTAVHLAAEQEDVFWLSEVLAHGGKVDVLNTGNPYFPKQTPLYYAINARRAEAAKMLVNAKADINAVDSVGRNPTFYAMECGMYAVAKATIQAGADPNLWAHGKFSVLTNNGWFQPWYPDRLELSERTAYYELYDCLAERGYVAHRETAGGKTEGEKRCYP